MNFPLRPLFGHALAALTLALPLAGLAATGCASNDPQDLAQSGLRVCDPAAFIRCLCPNSSEGVKRCNDYGTGFDECRISETRACDEPPPVMDAGPPPVNKCGNGTVDPGEACDDGNKKDGDFCSSVCLPTGDPKGAGLCPGVPVHLWGSEVIEASANTVSYPNSHKAENPCNMSMGLFGNDRVFAITAHKAGALHVETSAASYDVVLFVNKTCLDSKTEVACANANYLTFEGEQLDTPIKKDETLYVIVDGGPNSGAGDTQVRFSIR
jgi:cysteine-rich repeat protein